MGSATAVGCISQHSPAPREKKGELSMKSIRCWDDLSKHGIIPLTGEACGLSYRILCDVTATGQENAGKGIERRPIDASRKLESRHCR